MGLESYVGKELPQIDAKKRIEADSFYQTGMYAFEKMNKSLTEDGNIIDKMSVLPAIVNTAFACELYLKSLLKNTTGHKLEDLFNAQDDIVKQFVKETIIKNNLSYTDTLFEEKLKNISNSFVNWRYFYETDKSGNTIDIDFLKTFANALRLFIVFYK